MRQKVQRTICIKRWWIKMWAELLKGNILK